jgi:transglutaminase-like putative cysteine protease
MSRLPGIPRVALIWLLVAQVLVIVPHLVHLPMWMIALWLAAAGWRVQIFRMRARYPNGWAKGGLVLLVLVGILLSRGTLVGLDAAAVLLIATFTLKLLEMRSRRDALVVIFLGFFCVVTAYLFEDGILAALYSLLPITALLAALVGLQHGGFAERPWPTLRLAGSLMLQALPLMVLLFVFFPRMGPLWSLPLPSDKGVTGLSDSMEPADIAELGRSSALAFRASFEGEVPPRAELYWRALTLERFDGRRWSQSAYADVPVAPQWSKAGEPLDYSIIMQPSGKRWLFALDVGEMAQDSGRMMSDFRWQRLRPVDRPQLYQVRSWPKAVREGQARPPGLRLALQLPEQGDPRSRAWAAELQAQYPQSDELVAALLQHFNREPYVYTLRPQPLGADSIDDFLFNTRRGFCAHYAGAMTFVLRAAGIPARVVVGYQGGELNPNGNYIQVRQFDAHAWVEYWQPGQGWRSVDPTFQVAPERIERGLEEALSEEDGFLDDQPFSPLRYRELAWLNQLRMSWESLNYGWQRWVLGYQGEQQMKLLQSWLGSLDWQRLALGLVGTGALLLGLLALWLLKPLQQRADPQRQAFRKFERLLAGHAVRREPGEGARSFALRAARQLPEQAAQIEAFARCFEQQRYAGEPASRAALLHALSDLRRALPWRASR